MATKLKLSGSIFIALILFTGTIYLLLRFFPVTSFSEQPVALKRHIRGIKVHDGELNQVFYTSPNLELDIELTLGKETIYRQSYKADENLLRIPLRKMTGAKAHAFFAGCSFVWGEGITEKETLPAQFQDLVPSYQAYNLGFPGGGLHSHLRYTELFPLSKVIKERKGIYFYTFITHHLDRFFGRYNFAAIEPVKVPHYRVEAEKLVFKGEFKEQPFFKRFKAAKKLGMADALIRTQNPLSWSDEELREFATGVKFLKERYLAQFPEGKFIFVFHPLARIPEIVAVLKRHLTGLKIAFLDPASEFERLRLNKGFLNSDLSIPYDRHPTGKGNLLLAESLAEALKMADQSSK